MKIKSIFLVLLLVLLPVLRVSAEDNTAIKEEELLFMAKKAMDDGFYDMSFGLLDRFLENYPNSSKTAEANLIAGECFFHQNNFVKALSKFNGLLNDPQAKGIKDALYYWIAEINFKENDFPRAGDYYKKIISEFPASSYIPIAYYSLGWCLTQEHKFQEALGYFRLLEKDYPKEPQSRDAAFKIMECLYNTKEYAALKEKIKSALAIFSKDALRASYIYFYLGEANYYLGDFAAAQEAYSKVLANSLDEKMRALSKLNLGWSYFRLKRYKDAEDVFWSIKQEDLDEKGRDILLLGKAMLLMDINRVNEANKLYEQLLNVTSDPLLFSQGLIGRADALYNLADYPEASSAYREAIAKINIKDMPSQRLDKLYYNLGWSLLKQGDNKAALEAFQKAVDASDDNAFKSSALSKIGDIYQEGADYAKAQEAYSLLLKNYPDSSYGDYCLYQLGSIFLKESNYDKAIFYLSTLEKNFPASKLIDDAVYSLGLAYYNKQDYTSCREALNKFLTEFKESDLRPTALYLLGNCSYDLEDYPEAIRVFKELLRSNAGLDSELAQKAQYQIADSFYQSGEEKEALSRFNALRSKYPNSSFAPEVVWWLGNYYYRHDELALAARYYLSLIRDFPKSGLLADAYYALGLIFTEQSRTDEALDSFKKAVELNKVDLKPDAAALLHLKIAEIRETKGEADDALKEYLEAARLSGGDSALALKALFRIGQIYEDKGNFQEALDTYQKIFNMGLPESRYAEEQINRIKAIKAKE